MFVLVFLAGIAACPGSMNFLGDTRLFMVEQICNFSLTIPAVEGTKTAVDFYDYRSASSHTGFEVPGRSFVFLYRDLNTPDKLALFWLHGFDGPEQTRANVKGRISGIPPGAAIAQADDNSNEFDWTNTLDWSVALPTHGVPPASPYIAGRWSFISNTDGGALDQLSMTEDWNMKIEVQFVDGMDDWRLFFADGSNQQLDPAEPLYIKSFKPEDPIAPYPGFLETATFCALVVDTSNTGNLTYTFSWEDGKGNTVVSKASSELACSEHKFCTEELGCGGVYPRNVTVTVVNSCGESVSKILASETSRVSVKPTKTPCPTDAPTTPVPVTLVPGQTYPPDTAVPTPFPDTAVPTAFPDTQAPPTPVPETLVPPTPLPPGSTYPPITPAPDTVAPDTQAPDTQAPSTPVPETLVPPTPLPPGTTYPPNTPAPVTPVPQTLVPGSTAVPTVSPSTTAPATLSPVVATLAPGTTAVPLGDKTTVAPGGSTTEAPDTETPGNMTGGGTVVPTPAPDSSSGVPIWAIVVPIVVVLLGGCGAAGYFYAKNNGMLNSEKTTFGETPDQKPTFGTGPETEMFSQDFGDMGAFEPETYTGATTTAAE